MSKKKLQEWPQEAGGGAPLSASAGRPPCRARPRGLRSSAQPRSRSPLTPLFVLLVRKVVMCVGQRTSKAISEQERKRGKEGGKESQNGKNNIFIIKKIQTLKKI